VGAHALVFQWFGGGLTTISTSALSTAATGSTILVGVGRGAISAHEQPTDNKSNPAYPQVGSTHAYTNWPTSGTALYVTEDAVGGAGHIISTDTPSSDEVTMMAVEVIGGPVEDYAWNEDLSSGPVTSDSVTTAGPATLVAFWWGDGGAAGDKTAVPNNGFTVIESIGLAGDLVQGAVAVRHEANAGTYDVTWTATPDQGAQMWLVAVAD
jgi:hypothetical protein